MVDDGKEPWLINVRLVFSGMFTYSFAWKAWTQPADPKVLSSAQAQPAEEKEEGNQQERSSRHRGDPSVQKISAKTNCARTSWSIAGTPRNPALC